MMKIAENQVVTIHYSVYNNDEVLLDSSRDAEPLVFLQGKGFVISGLDDALLGREKGETFTVKVDSDDAYGPYNDGLAQEVPRDVFGDMEIEVGMQLRATTEDDSEIPVIVTGVTDETITVDANPPLAGVDLVFDVEILDIRDATPEELEHGNVHDESE